ncbi:hypothetical protein PFISCL1PPCAC_20863, partial [Pristionchus fissidentatus]
ARFDFTQPSNESTIILKVGEKKLHVSKQILSVHSPVFAAMFYGEFEEKNKEEIEINEVKYEEFVDLLNMIYPTSIEANARTVAHILKLADLYDCKVVLERAESYLIDTTKFTTAAKLKMADEYRLDHLK